MVEKSSTDDAAAVVAGERTMEHLEVASEDTVAAEDRHSTSGGFVVIGRLARHTFSDDRVRKEMQQRLESSIAEYGMRWEGMGASFARLP